MTKRRFFILAAVIGWFGHDGARGQETIKVTADRLWKLVTSIQHSDGAFGGVALPKVKK